MTSEEAVLTVIDALEAAAVPYMTVGSLSSNLYSIPRSTQDADFVIHADENGLKRLRQMLKPPFQWESQIRFETITSSSCQVVTIDGLAFKIELFFLSQDPFNQQRFARRAQVPLFGRSAYAATPEDVIIQKLRWSKQGRRHKDIDDARNVIAVQGNKLDWPYIERWCDAHGTRERLDELRRTTPVIPDEPDAGAQPDAEAPPG